MSLFGSFSDIAGPLVAVGSIAQTAASIFAGNEQADAARDAQRSTQAQANQARADFAPWRGQGQVALYSLADLMGQARPLAMQDDPSLGALSGAEIPFQSFEGSPGMQFRLKEGQKARDNVYAARGMLRSGGRIKEAERYAQGVASDEFNNEFARRSALAGTGQAATSQSASLGASLNAQANQFGLDRATARGSAFVGAANGVNNAFQQLMMAKALEVI